MPPAVYDCWNSYFIAKVSFMRFNNDIKTAMCRVNCPEIGWHNVFRIVQFIYSYGIRIAN